jgi:lipopolysaccharide export system protein LptA
MNKTFFATMALVSTSLLAGCSGSDGEIKIEAGTSALTDKGKDALFTIEVTAAREGGYDLEGLAVKATLEGKDAVTLVCSANDANTNKKLDKGEKLTCTEGETNAFDATTVGKAVTVELTAKIDAKDTRIGEAIWTPAK